MFRLTKNENKILVNTIIANNNEKNNVCGPRIQHSMYTEHTLTILRISLESQKLDSTYIHRAAILRRKLARLLRGGNIPGGPGSERGSCRRRNVSAKCSALWLDSRRASPVKSSNVTKSTAHGKKCFIVNESCALLDFVDINTVVVGGILVGRARKLDESKIG